MSGNPGLLPPFEEGLGASYWFNPLSSFLPNVPVVPLLYHHLSSYRGFTWAWAHSGMRGVLNHALLKVLPFPRQ